MYVARHHRHQTPPVIQDALTTAIAQVRSDEFDNDWVLAGFDGRDNIQLIGTGTGGVEALKENIVKWDVCYGLVRTVHTLERAGFVQTDFVKFVWVYWRPEDIPVMRKMKIGVHEGQLKQLFSPYHAELNASEINDIGTGPLASLLDSVTMSADKTGARVMAPSPVRRSAAKTHLARARSLLPAVQMAMANEFKKVRATDVSFEDPDAFANAIRNVRSDVNFADWCLVGYKDKETLRLVGAGRGGLDALLDAAEPAGVNYGLLRISEKFDMVFHEAFCFITWMPESVPAVMKARISTHQGAVATAFRSHVHCQFQFRAAAREDITIASIRDRVRQVIGSQGTPKKVFKPRSNNAVPRKIKAPAGMKKSVKMRSPARGRSPKAPTRSPPSAPSAAAEPKSTYASASAVAAKSSVSPAAAAQAKASRTFLGLDFGFGDSGNDVKGESKDAQTTLQEAVERVKKGGDETDFIVVGWRNGAMGGGSKGQQLEIKEMGSGGVAALAECLQAHSVLYGLVRVKDNMGAYEKEKFCCVRWAPEAVPVTPRAKIGAVSMRGEVARLFHPYHGDLAASNTSELTSEAVAARVTGGRRRLKQ